MINLITVVAAILIVLNVWDTFSSCRVKKNKYEVNEYVYVKTIGGPLLARVDGVFWESNVPHLIDGPSYNLYYVDAEKHVRLPESAILCKFKGERLITNE